MQTATPAPNWIEDALRLAMKEAGLYLKTLVGSVARPGRFAEAWRSGAETALNPLGFAASSVSVLATVSLFTLGGDLDGEKLAGLLVPYLHCMGLGFLVHVALKAFGSKEPFRATLGLSLFNGGGAALLRTLLLYAISDILMAWMSVKTVDEAFAALSPHHRIAINLLWMAAQFWVLLNLAWLLAAAHRVARAKVAIAVLGATILIALLYGVWRPPSSLGAHFAILRTPSGQWALAHRF
jgi:hypothetical protein